MGSEVWECLYLLLFGVAIRLILSFWTYVQSVHCILYALFTVHDEMVTYVFKKVMFSPFIVLKWTIEHIISLFIVLKWVFEHRNSLFIVLKWCMDSVKISFECMFLPFIVLKCAFMHTLNGVCMCLSARNGQFSVWEVSILV